MEVEQNPRNNQHQRYRNQELPSKSDLLIKIEQYSKLIVCLILIMVMLSFYFLTAQYPKTKLPASTVQKPFFPSKLKLNYSTLPTFDTSNNQYTININLYKRRIQSLVEELLNQYHPNLLELAQIEKQLLKQKQSLNKKYESHTKKVAFFNQKSIVYPGIQLEQFNLPSITSQSIKARKQALKKDHEFYNSKYHISDISSEIPICQIVYATKTINPSAPQYLLTSLFNQQYENFRVVIIYDDVLDNYVIQQFKAAISATDPSRTMLIINPKKLGYWDSISSTINNHCSQAEIINLLSINDQLLGFNVFSTMNAVYQIKNANIVYSNYLEYHKDVNQVLKGVSFRYDDQKIRRHEFRMVPLQYGPMFSFRKKIFSYVLSDSVMLTPEHSSALQVQVGLYTALLELSCGKIEVLPEYLYLIYGWSFDSSRSVNTEKYRQAISGMQKYQCYRFMKNQ